MQQRQLVLMGELASVIEQSHAALLASDIKKIGLYTARQHALCEALSRPTYPLPRHDEAIGARMEASVASGSFIRSRELEQKSEELSREMAKMRARIQHLNRVQAALLRRSRRSLEILIHLLASCATTYSAPKSCQVPLPCR
jgi:hypothetical protein